MENESTKKFVLFFSISTKHYLTSHSPDPMYHHITINIAIESQDNRAGAAPSVLSFSDPHNHVLGNATRKNHTEASRK